MCSLESTQPALEVVTSRNEAPVTRTSLPALRRQADEQAGVETEPSRKQARGDVKSQEHRRLPLPAREDLSRPVSVKGSPSGTSAPYSHLQDMHAPRSSVDKLLSMLAHTHSKGNSQVTAKKGKHEQTERAARRHKIKEVEDGETSNDNTRNQITKEYRWLTRPSEITSEQSRIYAVSRLRAPVLGPKHVKDRQFEAADQLWSRVFQILPGATTRTAAIMAKQNPERGRDALRKVLRTRNAKGLATQARHVLAFQAWHLARWPKIPWNPPDGSEVTKDLYCAILADFLEDLMDSDVAPGVPKTRLTSLRAAVRICRPTHPWPLDETLIVALAQAYFREGRHKKRVVRLYTVLEIKRIEAALGKATSSQEPEIGPLERLVLATELRKLYARLRQDDAIWGKASIWKLVNTTTQEGEKHVQWHGEASKTKGTEMRANWVHETMPWVAPVRGLSDQPVQWQHAVLNDMITLGMSPTDDYLLPSPAAVRAGRRPPGATDHSEWITLLRRTLVRIGFEPDQAASICGHTAKRTMLTWLNSSGLVRTDQDQQAAGYHRAKGPGSVSRRYTLNEQAGPIRTIEAVCGAIRRNEFHPDRPVGAEWDATCEVLTPQWDERLPAKPTSAIADAPDQTWSSDDEAPPDRNPFVDTDAQAEDLLDIPSRAAAGKKPSAQTGYIVGTPKLKSKKGKRYHVAVLYDWVPETIIGCKAAERRGHVKVGSNTHHVLCDTHITNAVHTNTARQAIQNGFTLCNVCRSRRRRWRQLSTSLE